MLPRHEAAAFDDGGLGDEPRMNGQSLDHLLKPRSVAVVGASERERSVGRAVCRNLLDAGFSGRIHFVNPKHSSLFGRPCHAALGDLDEPVDLAIVATPAAAVADVIAEAAAGGTAAAIVLTAAIADGGRSAADRVLRTASESGMRIIGPNCLGVLTPSIGLNASFAHISALPGRLAFISQSGAILTSVLDWAVARQVGFSSMASIGNALDVAFADLIDYFAADRGTSAILLYVESVQDAPAFVSAARRAARIKPVIVMKVGRYPEGARAALSHTGALAGSDAVYDAAFRRSGLVRVYSLEELFDAAAILGLERSIDGEGLTIVTNGGGAGVIAADCLHETGGRLAQLDARTRTALDAALPGTWSHANPVDIIGDADGPRFGSALKTVLDDPQTHAALVIRCPTSIASAEETARSVVDAIAEHRQTFGRNKPVLTCWLGQKTVAQARAEFEDAGIPTFESPEDAVRAFMHMISLARTRETMMRTPRFSQQDFPVDRPAAEAVVAAARRDGRSLLSETESKALLSAYGIRVAPTTVATTPAEAGAIVEGLLSSADAPAGCVLKIASPDITHKSDVGGVRLGIRSGAAAREAAEDMLRSVAESRPDARIEGIAVEPMIDPAGAHELIVGIGRDPTFGPVLLFGAGGTAVEAIDDKAVELPPLDELLAQGMIGRTRISRLLSGYRNRPPADLAAIAEVLIRLARLAEDLPDVAELDVNPLLADAAGVVALDARVVLTKEAADPSRAAEHLAIAPYPEGWDEDIRDAGGGTVHLRPILPTDEHLYPAFFDRVSQGDIRLRLFSPRRHFTHGDFARWTQIDYRREMAFVALDARSGDLLGVSRIASGLDPQSAEFAILVRSDVQGRGIGYALMRKLIAYARARTLDRLCGTVLRDNTCMRSLCRALGFTESWTVEGPDTVLVEMNLTEAAGRRPQ